MSYLSRTLLAKSRSNQSWLVEIWGDSSVSKREVSPLSCAAEGGRGGRGRRIRTAFCMQLSHAKGIDVTTGCANPHDATQACHIGDA